MMLYSVSTLYFSEITQFKHIYSKSGLDRYYFPGSNVDQVGVPNFGGLDLRAQKELEDDFQHVTYRICLKIVFNAFKLCLNDVRSV